jgi:hypothetical protein
MANALVQQVAHMRTLVAALVPATAPDRGFRPMRADVTAEQSPLVSDREFTVRADLDTTPETLQWFGVRERDVRARVRLSVLYDGTGDLDVMDARVIEDTDQIVSQMELPASRVSADVRQVVLESRQVQALSDAPGFVLVSLFFTVDYRVETGA